MNGRDRLATSAPCGSSAAEANLRPGATSVGDRRHRGGRAAGAPGGARLAGIGAAALLCAALASAVPAAPPAGGPPAREEVRVLFVPDGDTVRARWRGGEEWVRLLRVNAPERDRRGYAEARALLRRLVTEEPVLLEFERPGEPERDRHGRLLGYLFAAGKNCSGEIVRAGWSRFWTRYGAGRYAGELRAAEDEARAARRGLWDAAGRFGR